MLLLVGFYLLNSLALFLITYWNGVKTFYEISTPYLADVYLLYVFIPLCIYSMYRKVFNTNYFVVSRYHQKKAFMRERYLFIAQQNMINTIFLVCLPLVILLIVYQMYDLDTILIIGYITLRYFLIGLVMCSLYFTLFLTFPILQRKLQLMLVVFLPILPLILLLKEILKSTFPISWLYYLDLGVTLPQNNEILVNFVVNNAQLVAYYCLILLLRFVIIEKVELFQHENHY